VLIGPFGGIVAYAAAATAANLVQCRLPSEAGLGDLYEDDGPAQPFVFAPARARIGAALVPLGYIAANGAFVLLAHLMHRAGTYTMVSFPAVLAIALMLDLPALALLRRALTVKLVLDDDGVLICNPLRTFRFAWRDVTAIRWGTFYWGRAGRVPALDVETVDDPGPQAVQLGTFAIGYQRSAIRPLATYSPTCADQQRLLDAVARHAARHSVRVSIDTAPVVAQ
jgi:hypothetical protein